MFYRKKNNPKGSEIPAPLAGDFTKQEENEI